MQFHHHCFVTFWTRPWVLQLRVMKALEWVARVWQQHTVENHNNCKNKVFTVFWVGL